MQYTVAMQSCRSFALWGPAVQYAVAMQSYRRLICPDFVCLMDGGCSVYCGQSSLRLPYGRWLFSILWPVLSFNCLMWAGSAIYCGQSCRLIALCGSAVQYTVASPVGV